MKEEKKIVCIRLPETVKKKVDAQAKKLYLSTKSLEHEGPILQDIFTCTKGIFNGEVVDVFYDITNNEVKQISVSSQFHTEDEGQYETTPKILNYIYY